MNTARYRRPTESEGGEMTPEQMRLQLWLHIKTQHKTSKCAASHWGVTPSFVSAVLNGKKGPNTAMLKDIGLVATRLTVYSERFGCGDGEQYAEGSGAEPQLVSYAPNGRTCTLNFGGKRRYYDEVDRG